MRRAGARGFTLVELLIAVTILGVISIGITMTFTVLARTTDGTQARLTQSRGPKLVGVYWMPDVNSSETVNPTGTVCGSVGTPLVTFLWNDERYGTLVATWSTNTAGSTTSLVRTRCTVTDGVVSSPVQTTTVAPDIAPPPATRVQCGDPFLDCASDATPDYVLLTLATADGRSFDVYGDRKVTVS